MYQHHYIYSCPYYVNTMPYRHHQHMNQHFFPHNSGFDANDNPQFRNDIKRVALQDYGKQPFVINIEEAAERNNTFRTALWTGEHLQVTLMSINVGEDIGLEIHPTTDQFLRIEDGHGMVEMGNSKNNLTFRRHVHEDGAIMVPAGTWHNITNIGAKSLKLYTIYAPPHHPFGTIEQTKADAMAAEHHH